MLVIVVGFGQQSTIAGILLGQSCVMNENGSFRKCFSLMFLLHNLVTIGDNGKFIHMVCLRKSSCPNLLFDFSASASLYVDPNHALASVEMEITKNTIVK